LFINEIERIEARTQRNIRSACTYTRRVTHLTPLCVYLFCNIRALIGQRKHRLSISMFHGTDKFASMQKAHE